ncbi:MAG TPA: PIN domain-containing protein [Acidobacteriaceae bacterium]|nr:PIN domain-containing protein [Acidobacteriaceae bacterium]
MIAYLDTNVAVWLAEGNRQRISPAACDHIERSELRLSPMVLMELEYLREIQRILLPARDLLTKLSHELGVRVCDLDFPTIIDAGLGEKWTRDPFDRIIVAQAKANGFAWLISADAEIQSHYPRTVW